MTRLHLFSASGIALAAALVPSLASAQASPWDYTSATRYDDLGRVVGTISADPDGVGSGNPFLATRTTYDVRGNVIKVESGALSNWQSEGVDPATWTGFTIHTIAETTYDAGNRKLTDKVSGKVASTVTVISLTQYSYDNRGRLECIAIRMNPAAWNALPSDACTLGTEGANGPDRITRTMYDDAGQVLQIRKAVGTSVEIADATYSYTDNGQMKQVVDANGNRAELRYDGHGRQKYWVFPSATRPTSFSDVSAAAALNTAGALNESDYEEYTYDKNGNRTKLRKRDGREIGYSYDNLNRMTVKDVCLTSGTTCSPLASTHTRDVYYEYDLRGLQTKARFNSLTGPGMTYTFDGFGRLLTENDTLEGKNRSVTYDYDANGNPTGITHTDGVRFDYEYDGLNRLKAIDDPGGTALATYVYDGRGSLTTLDRPHIAPDQAFGYDSAGRLNALGWGAGSSSFDVDWAYTRNPASQILTETQTNDSYSWDGHVTINRSYTTNGLNQYESAGGASFCYDDNGNLTADGGSVYLYDVENRLVERRAQGTGNTNCASLSYAGALIAELRYDPTGRLYYVRDYAGSNGITRFQYAGNALIAEYANDVFLSARHVHGSNNAADDPIASWDNGSDLNFLYADPRGSIVLRDPGGFTSYNPTINTYDEYGIPSASNTGRFQYTGQVWLEELGMYYYKARIYSPTLGRFLQTDPIGYDDQFNLYAYVGNDPINAVDPTGLYICGSLSDSLCDDVDGFVDQLRRVARRSTLPGSRIPHPTLRAAVKFVGEKNKGGPTITMNPDKKAGGSYTAGKDGSGTINIDPGDVNSVAKQISESDSISFNAARRIAGAAILGHEAAHGVYANQGFANEENRFWDELAAYEVEAWVYRLSGVRSQTSPYDYRGLVGRAWNSCAGAAMGISQEKAWAIYNSCFAARQATGF